MSEWESRKRVGERGNAVCLFSERNGEPLLTRGRT